MNICRISMLVLFVFNSILLYGQNNIDREIEEITKELIYLDYRGVERIKFNSEKWNVKRVSIDNLQKDDLTYQKLVELEFKKIYPYFNQNENNNSKYIYKLRSDTTLSVNFHFYQIGQPFGMGDQTFESVLRDIENKCISEKVSIKRAMDQLKFDHSPGKGVSYSKTDALEKFDLSLSTFFEEASLYSIFKTEKAFIRPMGIYIVDLFQKTGNVFNKITIYYLIIQKK